MLVLLRAHVLTNESPPIHVVFELLNSLGAMLLLDGLQLVEPDMGHLSGEAPARVIVLWVVGLRLGVGEQGHVLGADAPRLNAIAPGDLHVLSVRLQRLQHLDALAFQDGAQRACQNVVLLHVVFN